MNVPEADIMKMGGWETDYVMKGVYRHAMEDKNKQVQREIDKQISTKNSCNRWFYLIIYSLQLSLPNAAGGTWTRTKLPSADFESAASAIPPLRQSVEFTLNI